MVFFMKFFGLSLSSAIQFICSLTYHSRRKQTRNNVHEIIFLCYPSILWLNVQKLRRRKKMFVAELLNKVFLQILSLEESK